MSAHLGEEMSYEVTLFGFSISFPIVASATIMLLVLPQIYDAPITVATATAASKYLQRPSPSCGHPSPMRGLL